MPASLPGVRIALLIQDLDRGGVERCFLNLARGFTERGIDTDLYVGEVFDERLLETAGKARLLWLQERTADGRSEELAGLLDRNAATVVLTGKDDDARLMIEARRRMAMPPRLVMVASVDYSGQLRGRRAGIWKRWWRYRRLRRQFSQADQVFCVSEGVAHDMARILRCPRRELPALPNPVVTPELSVLSNEAVDHPWLETGQPPLILGVGRLSRIKNFPLLVRAFAMARREMPMRLMILGEGKQRADLLRQAARLGIAEDVALPGFVTNPYPYMRRANLFVLSSLWEGFGNVLVEALACGTPVVATDCPSGPSQILNDGEYGSLVPVDDSHAMAAAIIDSLRHPPPAAVLAEAVEPYRLANSTAAYLAALGLDGEPSMARAVSHQL